MEWWGNLGVLSPSYDADAQAFITLVEAADGQALEAALRDAINAFVVGCKADGIWTAIKACCILAGARTLAGALVPLVGTAPTSYNFGSGDYNRKTGLVGDGSTKYINSNRNNNADPQNSRHLSVYVSSADSQGAVGRQYIGTQDAAGGSVIGRSGITANLFGSQSCVSAALVGRGADTGLIALTRSASTGFSVRSGGTSASITANSDTPRSESILVFARPSASINTNARISFYSIGENLAANLLDTRVSALMNALAAAIP